MTKRSILIIGCYFFWGHWGWTQTVISVSEYILERVNQLDNLPENSFNNQAFEASWVDGIDIRTETDEFNFNRQRYLVRVSPNTPKMRKAQDNLHQLYLKQPDFKYGLLEKDFIEIAYKEVLKFYESTNQLAIKEELLIVLQDQEKVLRKLNQLSGNISKDWIDVQQDIAQLDIELYKEREKLKLLQSNGSRFNTKDLLPAENILDKIAEQNTNLFQLQAQDYDIKNLIIEREEELEAAEQKKLLDFVQIEYNGPHDNELKERVSLTAGIRLPFSSNRKLKMEEIAIEKEILQQERLAEKQVDQYKEKDQKSQLVLLTKELIFTKEQIAIENLRYQRIAEKSSEQAGGNPLFLLYQKENSLKRKLDILELEMEIYQEYIDFLILTEQLYQNQFESFLSK